MQSVIVLAAHKLIVLIFALGLDLGIPLCVERFSNVFEIALLVSLDIGEGFAVAAARSGSTRADVEELVRVPVDGRRRSQFELVSVLGAVLYLRCAQSCPSKA